MSFFLLLPFLLPPFYFSIAFINQQLLALLIRPILNFSKFSYTSLLLRCVVVGDGGVGKTSLLSTFATGVFPEDYVPTGHSHHSSKDS